MAKHQRISTELNKSKELLQGQGQLKRNIDDNLKYRKTKADVEQLTRDIESLEERLLSKGSLSAIEADLKRHSQEKERLNSEVLPPSQNIIRFRLIIHSLSNI
jgi:DNA repair protein RAD50